MKYYFTINIIGDSRVDITAADQQFIAIEQYLLSKGFELEYYKNTITVKYSCKYVFIE